MGLEFFLLCGYMCGEIICENYFFILFFGHSPQISPLFCVRYNHIFIVK